MSYNSRRVAPKYNLTKNTIGLYLRIAPKISTEYQVVST